MQKHEHWLFIAEEDLDSAKILLAESLMTALFHIQQCAEKSLKAYLILARGSALNLSSIRS